jgi:putative glycosyltransferase (TIGR04348 family)
MPASAAPGLLLVTPYTASANNGNWRTATRWAHLLAPEYRALLQTPDQPVRGGRAAGAVAMIALHARRSRAAIASWRLRAPRHPLVVALTGTDLYRDVPAGDREALASLDDADVLVVLQDDALRHLPARHHAKACVVYQSARALVAYPRKAASRLHCVMVAHLREEKDPRTVFAAWRRLPADLPATLTVIGSALDPALGADAAALAADDARVRWLGPRPHAWTRQAIRRAHLLVVPSRMEGGANVVVEAVTAGTAVIASRMSGNLGMLGDDHPGLFPVGDADALAALVDRACRDRTFLAQLQAAGERRAPRFAPEAERAALRAAVAAAVVRCPVE